MGRTPQTRRQILSALGLSAAAYAALINGLKAQSSGSADLDVAIVGAGAAGLTAGFLLNEAGWDFEIFEADKRYGGRALKDETFADFPIDLGGEWIHGRRGLLRELSGDRQAMDRATEYRPMTSDIVRGGRLRHDNSWARSWRGEQRFINTTWFDFFDAYMARPIRGRIRLNTAVQRIDYRGDTIKLTLRGRRIVTADQVIVTVPLNVLKDSDIDFRPVLPADKRAALRNTIMPDGLKLFLRFGGRFYPDVIFFEDGQIPDLSERIYYNAALDKPSQQNILGLFVYGALAHPWVTLSDRQIRDKALAELDDLYGKAASRSFQAFKVQNWSKSPYHRGAYSYFEDTDPADLGAPIEGRIHFAGEAYNRRRNGDWGFMHTAARTAVDVVRGMG